MHQRRGIWQAGGLSNIDVSSSTARRRRAVMTSAPKKADLIDYHDHSPGGLSNNDVPFPTAGRRRAVTTTALEKADLFDYQDIGGPLPLEEIGTIEPAGVAIVVEATGIVKCIEGEACRKLEVLATSTFHPLPLEEEEPSRAQRRKRLIWSIIRYTAASTTTAFRHFVET
ncbi:hypothetical protein Q3G72_027646 [Acer saccharum]|nr:hypothetical protein Q3G72_027646 [Acer saccharum]